MGVGVGTGVGAGVVPGASGPLGDGTGVGVGSAVGSSVSGGSVTRTVVAPRSGGGPLTNRSIFASSRSNLSPAPNALTATALAPTAIVSRTTIAAPVIAWVRRGGRLNIRDEVPPGATVRRNDDGAPRRATPRSGFQVERPHVARSEDRDRPPVERGDAAHPETLGRRDQQRVGESRPVLGRRLEVLGGPGEVGRRRRDEPDPAARDRPQQRQRRRQAQLALEEDIQLGERQRRRAAGARPPGRTRPSRRRG